MSNQELYVGLPFRYFVLSTSQPLNKVPFGWIYHTVFQTEGISVFFPTPEFLCKII